MSNRFWGLLVCVLISVISFSSAALQPAYKVGDIGPAGGLIFKTPYTTDNATNLYFEATPVTLEAYSKLGGDAGTYCNSLVVTNNSITYDDWFMPSIQQCEWMYDNLKLSALDDFAGGVYWTSNQAASSPYYPINFHFTDRSNWLVTRQGTSNSVRPVRSFSAPDKNVTANTGPQATNHVFGPVYTRQYNSIGSYAESIFGYDGAIISNLEVAGGAGGGSGGSSGRYAFYALQGSNGGRGTPAVLTSKVLAGNNSFTIHVAGGGAGGAGGAGEPYNQPVWPGSVGYASSAFDVLGSGGPGGVFQQPPVPAGDGLGGAGGNGFQQPGIKGACGYVSYNIQYFDNTPPNEPTVQNNSNTLTILPAGDNGGSGVARVEYSKDSGDWVVYTAPIIFTATGQLKARVVDNAGNISPEKLEVITISGGGSGGGAGGSGQGGGLVVPLAASATHGYTFAKTGKHIQYRLQKLGPLAQDFGGLSFDTDLLGIAEITSSADALFDGITLSKEVAGKTSIDVTGNLAELVNNANGTKWVTASFQVSGLQPVMLNGVQVSDAQGNVFPQFSAPVKYLDSITYNATSGEMTFRIYHFSEWSISQLAATDFAGTGAGLVITANGSDIEVVAGGQTLDTGDALQTKTIPVAKISGLAYATVLNDIPGVGNDLYKPMNPARTDYSVHFGYINRGNAADTFHITADLVSSNVNHFTYNIPLASKTIEPWQIVSFSIDVANAAAIAYERATLNVTVNIQGVNAVSYNAFANAYSATFGNDGVYGGVNNLPYTFVLETEGYNLKVSSRNVSIMAPTANGYPVAKSSDLVPGAKIKYDLIIKNESSAIAKDVTVKDTIPANCHLYYTGATPTIEGATGAWTGATNNNATKDTLGAVQFLITIPANGTATASYTVTLD